MTTENIYWGDLHSHCAISYGRGTLDRALRAARSHLDFCSITGHAFWPDMPTDRSQYADVIDYHAHGFAQLARDWPTVVATTEAHHQPGSFVPLLSYEWHSLRYGDHNVYLPDGRTELVDGADLETLRAAVPPDALLIPHHIGYGPGARGIDWDAFDAARSPVVEMVSTHGAAERDGGPLPYHHTMGPRIGAGTVAAGLDAGHRFGLIGSTDHHGGYPGHHGGGRTAVFADALTRDAILAALRARRCYAATGDKIRLSFHIGDAPMGAETTAGDHREIRIGVRGEDAIDRVELIKNGLPAARRFGRLDDGTHDPDAIHKIRLEWGWGERDRVVPWEGEATVEGGRLLAAEPVFRGEEVLDPRDPGPDLPEDALLHDVTSRDDASATWRSTTFGNLHPRVPSTSGLVLEVRGPPSTVLRFRVNGQTFAYTLADLLAGSRRHAMRGWLSEVFHVHRAVPETAFSLEWHLEDAADRDVDVYYLRVAQDNGEMAWSSPIWVAR